MKDKYKPDYRLSPKELLVALVNYDNGSFYHIDDVIFGQLKELTNDPDERDTSIELSFKQPPLPQEFHEYKYNRIRMSIIFTEIFKDGERFLYAKDIYDDSGVLDTDTFLSYLYNSLGFKLHNLGSDFEVYPLPEWDRGVVIKPHQLNYSYIEEAIIPVLPTMKRRVMVTDLEMTI